MEPLSGSSIEETDILRCDEDEIEISNSVKSLI